MSNLTTSFQLLRRAWLLGALLLLGAILAPSASAAHRPGGGSSGDIIDIDWGWDENSGSYYVEFCSGNEPFRTPIAGAKGVIIWIPTDTSLQNAEKTGYHQDCGGPR